MSRRKRIKKSDSRVFAVLDDEAKPGKKKVGRLSDMDTEEVSLVDRAANGKRFLVVKRDAEGNIIEEGQPDQLGSEHDLSGEDTTVKKTRVTEALLRVQAVKALLDTATVSETAKGLGGEIEKELAAIQFMLKGAGEGFVLIAPEANLDGTHEVSKASKTATLKTLNEVERRLTALDEDTKDAEVLDATQIGKISDCADLVAKAVTDTLDAKTVVVIDSVSPEMRDALTDAVKKSLTDLSTLFVALQTRPLAKGKDVASEIEVGLALHESLMGMNDAIVKLLGDQENVPKIAKTAVEISKAASMYRAEYTNNGYGVFLRTTAEKVAEYDTWEEAEMEALRRNVEMVTSTAKSDAADTEKAVTGSCKVKEMRGQYAVVDEANKVHGMYPDEEKAKKAMEALNAKTKKSDDETQEDDVADKETTTEKIGRPMKSDRLKRLKGAVAMLKQALEDLKAGSVSYDKFEKCGTVLKTLINEMSTEKMVNASRGIDDSRTTDPATPNVGSGVQPDTDSIGTTDDVAGEGAPDSLKAVLKQIEDLKAEQQAAREASEKATAEAQALAKKKDEQIAALESQVTSLKKTRSAPSAPPNDDAEPVHKGAGSEDEPFYWPADMANWDG